MRSRKIISIFILSIEAITLVTDASLHEKMGCDPDYDQAPGNHEYEPDGGLSHHLASSRDLTRFLSHRGTRARRSTCDKFPRICRAKGSPGHSCCKKRCVDLLADRLNCGMWGKKCKHNEICCKGKGVNPSFNRKHCGGCNNGCNGGNFGLLGLCNYVEDRRRNPERGFTWSGTNC